MLFTLDRNAKAHRVLLRMNLSLFLRRSGFAAGLWGASAVVSLAAQAPGRVCVVDQAGSAIPGAFLKPERAGTRMPLKATVTGADGCVEVPTAWAGYARIGADRAGFAHGSAPQPAGGVPAQITLQPAGVEQTTTVTADRGLAGVADEATSVAVLGQAQLLDPPALALDDRLRQVAGFQLYRRTSSWTANPTTEGVSLRGLGSTAASRTLVESDDVPLNDPFGGWIHWDEIPALAVAQVQLVRGGAADLYGSSAIGGVIAVDPVVPDAGNRVRLAADALGATENSTEGDLLVTAGLGRVEGLLAGSGVDTDGYVPTAPAFRGTVDRTANVAQESGRAELRAPLGVNGSSVFLRGNVLNEARGNGTPLQTNGTRLWRYAGGGDAVGAKSRAALRVFGDREAYRQSFSAIAANRNSETLTRLQTVPTDEFGFSLTASCSFVPALTGALGLDLREIRATDAETPVSRGVIGAVTAISAHQRALGGYAEGVWQPARWSVAGSVRVDSFRTFDGRQTSAASSTVIAQPEIAELLASPHLGVVRILPHGFALSANGFRAFRGPTLNELYRTGQVGQQTTLANPRLLAERATGFEFGGEFADLRVGGRDLGRLRASYFWTEVNRPISTVLLAQTATAQTLQRQNLGQIRSRGLSLEATSARWRGWDAAMGYQYAVATVTRFNTSLPLQANLTGNWIPEVPRQSVTAVVNYARPQWVNLHVFASYTGREFDDSANQFVLHSYPRFDLSGDRALGHGLSVYAGAQNVLDRSIDAGRTPILTLAAPRLVQGGLRYAFSR